MTLNEAYETAMIFLGPCGPMLSSQKKAPRGHLVVWNANICIGEGKVWYGDIDITEDESKLKELAKALNEKVYVLREMDARFANEARPLLEKAVFSTE